MLRKIAYFLGTVCGAGYSPLMPGSVASLLTVFFLYVVHFELASLISLLLLLLPLSLWSSGFIERDLQKHDPSIIVIDEVVGMSIALMGVPYSLKAYVFSFFAFRFFDILKPFPINHAEILFSGGLGIIMDDVLAGLAACLCTLFMAFYCGW